MIFFPAGLFFTMPLPPGLAAALLFAAVILPPLLIFAIVYRLLVLVQSFIIARVLTRCCSWSPSSTHPACRQSCHCDPQEWRERQLPTRSPWRRSVDLRLPFRRHHRLVVVGGVDPRSDDRLARGVALDAHVDAVLFHLHVLEQVIRVGCGQRFDAPHA